jgi:hypothetical protein
MEFLTVLGLFAVASIIFLGLREMKSLRAEQKKLEEVNDLLKTLADRLEKKEQQS